jgi:hypothetical protein
LFEAEGHGTACSGTIRHRDCYIDCYIDACRIAFDVSGTADLVARSTGFEFADAIPVAKRLPVKGADAWRALVESRTA